MLIQIRTQKIDLTYFLHYKKIFKYNIIECEYENNY